MVVGEKSKPYLSIVLPVYNEDESIVPLAKEITAALDGAYKNRYEVIFVDDGSHDSSYEKIRALTQKDPRFRAVKFRKNFGQTAAMDAGFKAARGAILIPMDADLQNDPHDIPLLVAKIEQGFDVVSGWRKNRKDPFFKKISSRCAHLLRKVFIHDGIHDSGCTLKAYRRECFIDLNLYGEMHRFIPAILKSRGFKVTEVVVNHRQRKFGRTKYTIVRILKGFLDLLVVKFWMQFSTRPIHIFGTLGILSAAAGFVISMVLAIEKLFYGVSLSNRPLLLLGVLLLILGVQFLVLGIIADMITRLYYERENTTYFIEEEIGAKNTRS